MQLSQKQKTFPQFFSPCLKSSLNLEHFEIKDDPHRFRVFEITDCESVVRQISWKSRFRGAIDKQHGKWAETLLKSAALHIHPIY